MRIFEAVVKAAGAMRSFLPHYSLRRALVAAEALALLRIVAAAGARLPAAPISWCCWKPASCPRARYLGLWNLPELRGIEERAMRLRSARSRPTPRSRVTRCCRAHWPLLCRAAEETGGVATQNRGTIGGNIANASPAADTPPALLVYDAELEIVSSRGHAARGLRSVSPRLQEDGPRADELIARIHLPRGPRRRRAVLPKGRHAARAGHLQGLSGRVRSSAIPRAA